MKTHDGPVCIGCDAPMINPTDLGLCGFCLHVEIPTPSCEGCGRGLYGKRRRWCSDQCQEQHYVGTCQQCGGSTSLPRVTCCRSCYVSELREAA